MIKTSSRHSAKARRTGNRHSRARNSRRFRDKSNPNQMKPQIASSRSLFPVLSKGAANPWFAKISVIRSSGSRRTGLSTLELCAGAGGQALGFEQAGFDHAGLVEIDSSSCATLRLNRPNWNVIEQDLNSFKGSSFAGVDVISGGLPCPPFSKAGKQLGHKDERNLFPAMISLVDRVRPKAVMIENVRGILDAVFVDYRQFVEAQIKKLGYEIGWNLMSASDFGVPQLRPRVVFIALRKEFAGNFCWPEGTRTALKTVGETLFDLMAANGWKGAQAWKEKANEIAPTLVGGSLKHGGPDLGPTRARRAWATLDVDGLGIADDAPGPNFTGMPRLTVRMAARIQGFPDDWQFVGKKTRSYRQVGNAFPPPFARAIAENLKACLIASRKSVRVAG